MVRIEDITGKRLNEQETIRKIEDLVKNIFGNKISIDTTSTALHLTKGNHLIGYIKFNSPIMTLTSQEYKKQAKQFAKAYEEQFPNEKEFVIQTDYSKNN